MTTSPLDDDNYPNPLVSRPRSATGLWRVGALAGFFILAAIGASLLARIAEHDPLFDQLYTPVKQYPLPSGDTATLYRRDGPRQPREYPVILIETAGGNNVFDVLERDYCRIDAEDVVAAKPDIIICYSQETLQTILNRKGWQDIPAIRNKRVYFEKDINPDWMQRATPRAILGMERLRELLDTF